VLRSDSRDCPLYSLFDVDFEQLRLNTLSKVSQPKFLSPSCVATSSHCTKHKFQAILTLCSVYCEAKVEHTTIPVMFMYVKRMLFTRGLEIQRVRWAGERTLTVFPGTGEPDLEAVAEMVAFLSDIDPFYRWNAAPQPLRIGGAWLTDLQSRRNQQFVAYEEGNLSKIAQLHENMFFNELIAGLWNYGYINDGKVDAAGVAEFSAWLRRGSFYLAGFCRLFTTLIAVMVGLWFFGGGGGEVLINLRILGILPSQN